MKKTSLAIIILLIISSTLYAGEILQCEGSIVNSINDFDKRITYNIKIVIPTKNAEEYVLTLSEKDSGKFKSLLQHNPVVRKSFIEISTTLDKDKGGKRQQADRYEYIVTKMPGNHDSLHGFIYGYTPWVLNVDTWEKGKPFSFFQTGKLIQGKCECE